jgi:mannopine transport system permease protein
MYSDNHQKTRAYILILPAIALLFCAFIIPLGFVFYYGCIKNFEIIHGIKELTRTSLFHSVIETTLEVSIITTVISGILGYIIALHLARQSPRWRMIFIVFVLIPFWVNSVVKSFAFYIILGRASMLSTWIMSITGDHDSTGLLFTKTAVVVGLVHYVLPYTVFPILSNLLLQDAELCKVAQLMGASSWKAFWSVTYPQSLPAVITGSLLAFVLSLGSYIVPSILGGRHEMMIANLIDLYARDLSDWGTASVIALVLLAASGLFVPLSKRLRQNDIVCSE